MQEDGSAEIKADCNQGRAGYDLTAPYFSLDQIALTRAQCPPGSLHDSFVESLGAAGSAVLQDGNLILVTAGGGRMRFAAAR
jgi:heat shock protein HslJ